MMKPTKGKYLCSIISDAKRLPSGLYIAETIKEKPHRAVVIEAGDPKDGKEQSAKKNDIVHFQRVWNREVPKDKTLIFVKEDEIVAIERG